MSHNASSLFSALSATSQAGTWKPVGAAVGKSKSLVASAFSPPSAEAADSVDVSPLGKALTGVAAKVFEKLDGKARSMLEESVKAGVLTADDVVKGLRGIAKEAVQNRYFREAPRTQEEIEVGEKIRSISDNKMRFNAEQARISDSFLKRMGKVNNDNSGESIPAASGSLLKEMTAALEDHKKNFVQSYGPLDEKVMKDGEEVDGNFMMRRLGNNLRHSDIFSGEDDPAIFSPSDSKAVEKLFNAGFRPAAYRDAATAFAAETDFNGIPDLQRPPALPQSKQAATDRLPPGYSDGKAQLDAAWQAASAMNAKKTGEEDPMVALLKANANATYSRQDYPALQPLPATTGAAAAGAGTATSKDATEKDAVLEALTRSLKSGVSPASSTIEGARTDTVV
ncbi:hypothetical protein AZL_d02370 (plasmid) [Azospirillum sp. B510]|uniref:hypothetical protein n=1 Tax=Azospirillum sp. (strain B510) TaxID=137722 RepID=UPI0001C4C6FE|nr:hypothetical protein [Azospirillum sp. B510]BAI76063.1 hypothetical protein AZL_d02370 [Azospirillum sp. B510]